MGLTQRPRRESTPNPKTDKYKKKWHDPSVGNRFSTKRLIRRTFNIQLKVSPLLELPAELRLEILHYLVVFPESLGDIILDEHHRPRMSNNYSSALSILSTCTQLRREALPIFYRENSFDIVLYGIHGDLETRMAFLGHEFKWYDPPSILTKVRRLNVVLKGWAGKMDEDDTASDRRMLHLLCETMTDILDLPQISLMVNITYSKRLTWDNYIDETAVLGALAFLRGLKSARVSGIHQEAAAQLESLMMKQEQIENIWKMKTSFQDWCELWTGDPETLLDEDATAAIYDCDIERFKRNRLEVIQDLGAQTHESMREVFQYDL